MSGLKSFHRPFITILFVPLMSLGLIVPSFAQKPGTEKSIYSPIVRVEAEKGFLMVTTGSGVLWVQASEAAKPHLSELPVGGLIDIIIEIRGKPTPLCSNHGSLLLANLPVSTSMERPVDKTAFWRYG